MAGQREDDRIGKRESKERSIERDGGKTKEGKIERERERREQNRGTE